MDLGLDGVPVAVAGASSGLGRAVALELAREGASVAICSRRKDVLEETAASITKQTRAIVHAITADVSTADGAREFIDTSAQALGGLQVLVTNAGGPTPGAPSMHDDAAWHSALDLNFMSAVRMIRDALPHMKKNSWGRIICITSNVVKEPDPQLSLSSAARSALTAFAKTLAHEIAAEGITVNCVMPGQIVTDRLRSLTGAPPDAGPEDPAFKAMAARIPVGRVGSPDEFAAVVAFMCSKRASFVNGVCLAVDGGFLRGLL